MLCQPRVALLAFTAVLGPCPGQEQGTPAKLVPVFGVVHNGAGKPVAGATVREVRQTLEGLPNKTALECGIGTKLGASATTNSHGKFVLKVSPGGRFGIVAMRGTERSQVFAPAAPAGQHELTLYETVRVKGRITDAVRNGNVTRNLPPRKLLVRAFGPVISGIPGQEPSSEFGMIEEVRSDAQGWFEVSILKGQACTLCDPWQHCKVTASNRRKHGFVLQRLVRKVKSRVVNNSTGEPVMTARLHLDGTTLGVSKNGEFELYLPRGQVLPITAEGFYPAVLSEGYNTSSIGMPELATAQLVVTAGDGQPASNLELLVWRRANSRVPRLTMTRHRTDARGKVYLTRMLESDYWVWANLDGRLVLLTQVPGGIEDIKLPVATKTYAVRGTVIDVDGLPAKHVPVFASPTLNPDIARPNRHVPDAFTDHAGKFTIPALTDRTVHITATGLGKQTAMVTDVHPKRGHHVQLQMVLGR